MSKEKISYNDVAGEKYPKGVKVEFETFSLIRLRLISDTKILLVELNLSTQNIRFLKIFN
jgi:hypothetical protein